MQIIELLVESRIETKISVTTEEDNGNTMMMSDHILPDD